MDSRPPAPPEPGSPERQAVVRLATPGGEVARAFDCWSTIGVNGDGTCPELASFVHCRNCPVYSAAAMQLLDRPLPAEYRQQWTEHFSREKKPATTGKRSVVIFRIGGEWLALPTRVFQEIAERRTIHSLPHRQQGIVLGLINIRGELLICVSLGRLLGLQREPRRDKPRTMYERLVVAEWQGKLLSFPVSEVYGIHRHELEDLREAPATLARAGLNLTRGILHWETRLVTCLDEDLLFSTLEPGVSREKAQSG